MTALTRTDADALLTRRVSGYLTKASITGAAATLTLGDGLGWGLRMLGYSPASHVTVTDTDLLSVTTIDALLDLAELRTLESVSTMFSGTTVKVGPLEDRLSDFAKTLGETVASKRAAAAAMHGHLLAQPLTETADTTVVLRSV